MGRSSSLVYCLPQSNASSSGEALVIAKDGSVILAGTTEEDFSGANAGLGDFFAIKLSPEMDEIWRWQVGNRAGCSGHPGP